MKRFRCLMILLAAVSAALVLAAGTQSAIAYFTTYAEAHGKVTVNFAHREEIDEHVNDLTKQITIKNQKGSQPVYVRARAYTGADYAMSYSGSGWTDGQDGWWYYNTPLGSEESTAQLTATLTGISENDLEEGKTVNVAVVYESTLVTYQYDAASQSYKPVANASSLYSRGHSQS